MCTLSYTLYIFMKTTLLMINMLVGDTIHLKCLSAYPTNNIFFSFWFLIDTSLNK